MPTADHSTTNASAAASEGASGKVNARDPFRHAPVFVMSPARGNSSVCVSMIGSHPQAYGFPELILFNAPILGSVIAPDEVIAEEGSREHVHSGLYRAIAQLSDGVQDEASLERAFTWVHQHQDWTVGRVFDMLLDGVAPLVGVEKSPESTFSYGPLARLKALYPRARFIHLTRHPIPSIASMQRHWEGRRWWPSGKDQPGPTLCAQTWRDTHRRILAFSGLLDESQVLRVRSEDLLASDDAELRRVTRWLGLRDDDAAVEAMRHPELSPYATPGPEGFFGGLDPTFLVAPQLRAPVLPVDVDFPSEWEIDRWVQIDIAILAAELGYTTSVSD